jgi:hypothetical protein
MDTMPEIISNTQEMLMKQQKEGKHSPTVKRVPPSKQA